jgi:transposase
MKNVGTIRQIGLDVHRKFSVASARGTDGRVVWRERLRHEDRGRLRQALAAWPKGVPVVMEATFGWGWLSDEVAAAGLEPHLASSTKVAAWRKARGLAKSDRVDADLITELPMEAGQRWWEVWLAPPEVRQQREWLRYRMTLVRLQSSLKNRVHAVLHRHGIVNEHSDLFGAAGRRTLQLLLESKDAAIPESARTVLKGYLQCLDHLRRQIAGATRELRSQVRRSPAGELLRTIPGLGFILSYTILAEVGHIDRFLTSRHLASYSLLAPRANESGREEHDDAPQGRHVGHIGRRTLKWAWIEAAHSAVRHGGRFREIFDRRTNNGRRDRSRGYIAVAHELCRLAHVVWKKGAAYREDPPPRPGSIKRCQSSCPGTGQPDPAMAAAESSPSGNRLQASQ